MSENDFKWRSMAEDEAEIIEKIINNKHYYNLINICDSVFVYKNEQDVRHLLENEKENLIMLV